MKIVLTLPVPTFGTEFHIVPDLGLGYLATALRKAGHEVEIVHAVKEGLRPEDLVERLVKAKPEAIGFKVFSADIRSVGETCRQLKRNLPGIPIILGGAHPSSVPERTFNEIPDADFLLVGEAETTLPQLVERIESGQTPKPEAVPGLVLPGQSTPATSPVFVEDLDALGHPAWDLQEPKTFPPGTHGGFVRRLPVAPIMATRGCPYECTFCDAHTVAGRRVRRRSVTHLIDEMRLLSREYHVREIHFVDDNLTLNKTYATDIFEAMLSAGLDLVWACPNGIRMETVDMELARLMRRSGCYSVAVGVESASPPILDRIKKRLNLEMVCEKVAVLREAGIRVTGFFIFGFPGDTRQGMLESLRFAKEVRFDKASFSLLILLPGTPLYQELAEAGKIDPRNAASFYYRVSYVPEGMTESELKRLQIRAFLEFYSRPWVLWRLLGEIKSWTQARILLGKISHLFKGQ